MYLVIVYIFGESVLQNLERSGIIILYYIDLFAIEDIYSIADQVNWSAI